MESESEVTRLDGAHQLISFSSSYSVSTWEQRAIKKEEEIWLKLWAGKERPEKQLRREHGFLSCDIQGVFILLLFLHKRFWHFFVSLNTKITTVTKTVQVFLKIRETNTRLVISPVITLGTDQVQYEDLEKKFRKFIYNKLDETVTERLQVTASRWVCYFQVCRIQEAPPPALWRILIRVFSERAPDKVTFRRLKVMCFKITEETNKTKTLFSRRLLFWASVCMFNQLFLWRLCP